jgi:hypothetical protein
MRQRDERHVTKAAKCGCRPHGDIWRHARAMPRVEARQGCRFA